MNKKIRHLYEELSAADKMQLLENFAQSPKMLRYIQLLNTEKIISTPKAIQAIYKEEQAKIENTVLTNRFYKLRQVLHLHLLESLKYQLKSITEEQIELNFIKLLLVKNDHAYALEKGKKLEQRCWDQNLFELLPELINSIILALHSYDSHNIAEMKQYVEKLEVANTLQYTFYELSNMVNSFRLKYISGHNNEELSTHYLSILTKIRRKITPLKAYPRFKLIYHYLGFSIGSLLQLTVSTTSNILTRHLNQLEQLLSDFPDIPILTYQPNHRIYNSVDLALKKAIFWYQKAKSKKSYKAILEMEQLRQQQQDIYIPITTNNLYNIVLCCLGAKEYEAALQYTQEIKEHQLQNAAIKTEFPYHVYELLAYTGLYPKKKHPAPEKLMLATEAFLQQGDEKHTWIYEVLGTFAMLYGFLKKSKMLLEHEPLAKEHEAFGVPIFTRDLLYLVIEGDRSKISHFIKEVRKERKSSNARDVILHLSDLEQLAKHFL